MAFLDILGTVLPILDKLGLNPLEIRSKYEVDQAKSQPTTEQKQLDLANSNLTLNQDIAQKNYNLQQKQFEYQKELNKQTQEREDNAIQRQVKDLQAAGLSPLMVSGGSAATPLTSANAPQFDLSGINNALSNVFGAYNDIFNRNMQKRQFALQSKVQSAQLYNELLDSKLNREYLEEKLDWEKTHGFRDLNWKSELLNIAESAIGKLNKNSTIPTIGDIVTSGNPGLKLDSPEELKSKIKNLFLGSSESNTPVYVVPKNNTKNIPTQSQKIDTSKKTFDSYFTSLLNWRSLRDSYFTDATRFFYRNSTARNKYKYDDFVKALKDSKSPKEFLSNFDYIEPVYKS